MGIDLGGTKMYAAVLNDRNKVIGSARRPSNGHEGVSKGLENLVATGREALESARMAASDLAGLGIGCPGVVDLPKGVLQVAPNLGWKNVPIRRVLSEAFGCPVTVLNDVDAGTYGEVRFGAAEGAASALGVFPGTGLGGGFIFRGQIMHGRRYTCMELGDVRMGGATLLRPVDEWPTLEDLTSRLAITSAIAVQAFRGKAPSLEGLPITKIKSKAIAKSIEAGEEAVEAILEQSIAILGRGLAGVVSLLAPEVIVLGGGLVERFPERYEKGVKKELVKLVTPELVEDLKVCRAALGDDAGVMGAAAYTEVENLNGGAAS